MEHSSYYVDIVDETGTAVKQKIRKDVDKWVDIYHSVHTLLVTPTREVVLTKIPIRKDLPNKYGGQLGVTAATMKRSNESNHRAAVRSLSRELFIDDGEIYHLGDSFQSLADGHKTYLSAYYLVNTAPKTFSNTDSDGLITISANKLREELISNPSKYAAIFHALWNTYEQYLPV
jgi:hypothetical protein